MSFLFKNTHTNKKTITKIKRRKEQGSFLAHQPKHISHNHVERASSFTSSGSITIEAALAAPIFFLGVLCLIYLLEMIVIQTMMQSALHDVGRKMAKEAYVNQIIFSRKMEEEIVNTLGVEWVDIRDIDCSQSRISGRTSIMELSLRYKLKVPVLMFRIPLISREETLRVKGWTGYAGGGFEHLREDTVYITETGIVYHKDADCTYLELSIQTVKKDEIPHLRNEDGGKYYPCEICGRRADNSVYITSTGNRYHSSVTCGGLKRSVYAVPISEVYGRGGCSRCVK